MKFPFWKDETAYHPALLTGTKTLTTMKQACHQNETDGHTRRPEKSHQTRHQQQDQHQHQHQHPFPRHNFHPQTDTVNHHKQKSFTKGLVPGYTRRCDPKHPTNRASLHRRATGKRTGTEPVARSLVESSRVINGSYDFTIDQRRHRATCCEQVNRQHPWIVP